RKTMGGVGRTVRGPGRLRAGPSDVCPTGPDKPNGSSVPPKLGRNAGRFGPPAKKTRSGSRRRTSVPRGRRSPPGSDNRPPHQRVSLQARQQLPQSLFQPQLQGSPGGGKGNV